MNKSPLTKTVLALILSVSGIPVVHASDLLDTLLGNGAITEKQYRELGGTEGSGQSAVPPGSAGQNVSVSNTGGINGRSSDGSATFRLRGRVQVDAASYDGGEFGGEEPNNGTELRRARLSLQGRTWNDWEYELEMDFGEDEPEVVDAFVRYIGNDFWSFRVGHIKEPFSLEEQTGNVNITFMERALPNVFAPDRNVGFDAQTFGDNWTFVIGLFGEGADDGEDDGEGYGISTRATFAPVIRENRLLHFGASTTMRSTNDVDELRFRARPESHISDVRYANTDDMSDVKEYSAYGLEFATVSGPFSLQSEYIAATVDRNMGLPELEFDGYYIYVSWVLTGESRTYRDRKGEFGGITPAKIVGKGGAGAWELGLRLSHLDLNDEDIVGGEQTNQTIGLNWYATPNIRFMINYINVESELDSGQDNEDLDILQARAQLVF